MKKPSKTKLYYQKIFLYIKTKIILNLLLVSTVMMTTNCYFDTEYSPWESKTEHSNLNLININRIKMLEEKDPHKKSFKVGLMSDLHHFFSESEDVISIFNNTPDLDFVIIVGDITNQGLLREYEWSYDIIKKLRVPFIVLLGNHDCLNNGKEIYANMFGPKNFSFSFRGVDFICFENNNWESTTPDYNWMEDSGKYSLANYKIHLSHVPNHNTAYGRFTQDQVDHFNIIIGKYYDLAIHGHAHFSSKYTIINNVARYTIGSPGYNHYGFLNFENDMLTTERY